MAVARFIIASIAIALVAAQANIDCTNAPMPTNADMNYYAPSADCRAANANVEACYTQWDQCTGNATNCAQVNACLSSVFVCLDNIPAPAEVNMTGPCYGWNESLSNVKMYLDMGGAYAGSGLQTACNYAACTYIAAAPQLNNNASCTVPSATCSDAPKAPAKFTITLGGNWATVFADSAKVEQVKVALQQGLARLLGVAPYSIRILSVSQSGKLVVEFAVLDPNVDGNQVATTLAGAVGNAEVVASAFSELAAVAGFAVTLENVVATGSVTLPPTPAPGSTNAPGGETPAPTPAPATPSSSASAVSAVAAVALVAMSLLF